MSSPGKWFADLHAAQKGVEVETFIEPTIDPTLGPMRVEGGVAMASMIPPPVVEPTATEVLRDGINGVGAVIADMETLLDRLVGPSTLELPKPNPELTGLLGGLENDVRELEARALACLERIRKI